MPAKVDDLFDEVKKSNPSYSDEQAWATAWSVYCKYVEPGSDHCHKKPSEYLKGKSAGQTVRVATRYLEGFEFSTPQQLKQYLKDHPSADPKKHTIKKQDEKAKKQEEFEEKSGVPKDVATSPGFNLNKAHGEMLAGLKKNPALAAGFLKDIGDFLKDLKQTAAGSGGREILADAYKREVPDDLDAIKLFPPSVKTLGDVLAVVRKAGGPEEIQKKLDPKGKNEKDEEIELDLSDLLEVKPAKKPSKPPPPPPSKKKEEGKKDGEPQGGAEKKPSKKDDVDDSKEVSEAAEKMKPLERKLAEKVKGWGDKAVSFFKKTPEKVQKFVVDEDFRRKSLTSAHKALTDAPEKMTKAVIDTAKQEVREFKEAGAGVKAVLKGGKMSDAQKHAFKTVATHMAIGLTAAALTSSGPLAIAGAFGKGLARHVALKAVSNVLGHLHVLNELGHIGHGVTHLMGKLAAEGKDVDPDQVMANLVAAAVAKELDGLKDEDMKGAVEEALKEEDSVKTKEAHQARRVAARYLENKAAVQDGPKGQWSYMGEPHPSREKLAQSLASLANRLARRLVVANNQPLYGYDSEANAYLVEDYPYGFRERTSIRYWLETVPRKGVRFCSQTLNPKTGRWNAAKKSTYAFLGGVMYLDAKGHVQWDSLSQYSDVGKVLDFVQKYPHAEMPLLKAWAKVKMKTYLALAKGEAVLNTYINDVKTNGPPTEEDIGRYNDEAEQWFEVTTYLK